MRRLNTKFDTNGMRAIVVPKRFAADIAGKYGPTRRRAQNGNRSSLVYRSSMTGKKKPLSGKPATIVRVQVVMPQPVQIVKVQETRVLRERVIVKESNVTKPTVHRERERENPVVRERIVEREKPVVRERFVEREKPVVRERFVEREKPIVRERIVEREKPTRDTELKRLHQRNTVTESRQTNPPGSNDPIRGVMPTFGRTIAKRGERKEAIKTLFSRQSIAREHAFRLIEEQAGRSNESLNTADNEQATGPTEKAEPTSYIDSIDSRSGRDMIIANRGSREPILLKKQRSPGVRQVVSVSSRDGASRQWNAVVLINRRTMDRMKTLSARMAAPIRMKQESGRGNKLADLTQKSLSVKHVRREASSNPVETRDTTNLHRESDLGQNAPQRPYANSGTVSQQVPGIAELARPADSKPARTNETARGSEPLDKLAVDKRLLDIDASIDRVSVTMSEGVPSESTFPISVRTIDHLGLTVRLMAARAERLGSTFVLRNRAEPGAAEASIPTSSKLILRRLTENPNTFISARRAANGTSALDSGNAAMKDAERSERMVTHPMPAPANVYPTTTNREPTHARPATPKSDSGQHGNPVTSRESSASKPIVRERVTGPSSAILTSATGSSGSKGLSSNQAAGQPEKSAIPPTSAGLGILRLSGRVKARLEAPSGIAASAPRAIPTGMIVHASRRGLSVLGRIANRTDIRAEGTTTRQANDVQPTSAQPNVSQPNAVQSNNVGQNTAQQNATQPYAIQPNVVGSNSGSSDSTGFASANTPTISANTPTISANGTSSFERTEVTDQAMRHPTDAAKLGYEEAAQYSSHLARLEPTISGGSGQIPRVRFTFRNRPNGSTAPNKTEPGVSAGNIQSLATASGRDASAGAPLASRLVPATNQRDTSSKIGNADARPVHLHWIARTSRSMTVARTQPSASNRNGAVANRTAADRVQALHPAQTTNPMQPMHPTQMTQPMHLTQPMQPITHQLLSGTESFPNAAVRPDEHPLVMAPSLARTALRRTRPAEARHANVKSNLTSAPAAMELRRNATQPVNTPAEPAPAAVTVEAPPQIDAKQLQKAIEAMPQLNPDQLAERVYAALMKKMKFERRLRGY